MWSRWFEMLRRARSILQTSENICTREARPTFRFLAGVRVTAVRVKTPRRVLLDNSTSIV